jgi:SAM-dependent methyltransferase
MPATIESKPRRRRVTTMIDPKQFMQEHSLEELCATAELFFQNVTDPVPHMERPFSNLAETPEFLYRMGLLLSGLRLGKSMVVLEFGAGTCWFSRFLNQMGCATISVDVSETALQFGRRLFDESPILSEYIAPPRFLHFDGRRLDLPDATVDRILCFDSFHHVPNQEQVLAEFFRVLKPGGIAGFCEPGREHSRSAPSQYGMAHYGVLENDIVLDDIAEIATRIGFGDMRLKLVHDHTQDLGLDAYHQITGWRTDTPRQTLATLKQCFTLFTTLVGRLFDRREDGSSATLEKPAELPFALLDHVAPALRQQSIFFLTKGEYRADSRSAVGLEHEIEVLDYPREVRAGQQVELACRIMNTGQAYWLGHNVQNIGVVNVGVHLLAPAGRMLELDFARGALGREVAPGEGVTVRVPVTFSEPGDFVLAVDLVAERIAWFEELGSEPQLLHVTVK